MGDLRGDCYTCFNDRIVTEFKMSGANITTYNPMWDLETEISIMEDLLVKGVDGIIFFAVDSAGASPVVDKVGAKIPICLVDQSVESDAYVSSVHHDQYNKGYTAGEAMVDAAERGDEHLNVFELWCPMNLELCATRSRAFNDAVADHPLITVAQQVAGEANEEIAMNAIMDAFPAHPELNAIYSNGLMVDGTREALVSLGLYHEVGEPEHIVWVAQDEMPSACASLRSGHMDACVVGDCWAHGDIPPKIVMTYVCLGQSVPKEVLVPLEWITPETVGISMYEPYGGGERPLRWGEMIDFEPDITKWPVLDSDPYGIHVPTYQELLEQ